MDHTRYIISDAAKMINVEPHVLRYWEEELEIDIPRNELDHRYYTEREVKLFSLVRDLKNKGFQLKAIKMIVNAITEKDMTEKIIPIKEIRKKETTMPIKDSEPEKIENSESDAVECKAVDYKAADYKEADYKIQQFKIFMNDIISDVIKSHNNELEEKISSTIKDSLQDEIMFLLKALDEREEQRFKEIDQMIRLKQRGRKQIAATTTPSLSKRQRRRLFGNKDYMDL